MRTSSVLARAGLVLSLLSSAVSSSPPVKVSLRTSWPSPPFFLELIETISLEEPDAFFPLLDVLTNPEELPDKDKLSPEAQQQLALQTALSAGYLSKPGALEAVQAQLALHAANPKIVAFYEHYSDNARRMRNDGDADASCGSWVDWYGEVVCDVERLVHLTGPETLDPAESSSSSSEPFPKPHTLAFDHIYPIPGQALSSPPRTAILYASFQSTNFRQLHSHLLRLSSGPTPRVQYIFRPIPQDGVVGEKGYLSGYGVTLDLKKMDYLALDDRRSHSRDPTSEDAQAVYADDAEADLDSVLLLLEQYPLNTTFDVGEPLTTGEIAQIGILAAQLVSESSTPLQTLKHLAQDFPRYATSLARRVVAQSGLQEEIASNLLKVRLGMSAVWLNGAQVSPDEMNPYSLLRLVRKERDLMHPLTSLGLLPEEAFELVTHPSFGSSPRGGPTDGLFDASDRAEDGGLIFWWNDIEKDKRYMRWQPSLYSLLHPMYPGQAPTVRRNMYNVVFILDLSQPASLHFLTNTVSMLVDRSYPTRIGLVPMVETEEGAKMARVLYYLTQHYSRISTIQFFRAVLEQPGGKEVELDWSHAQAQFEALAANDEIKEGDSDSEVMSFDALTTSEVFEERISKARAYARRLGTDIASSPSGHTFINGKYFALDDNFLTSLQTVVGQALQYFQEKVYKGAITDEQAHDIENHFYDLPTTVKRRNCHIAPPGGGVRILNLPDLHKQTGLHVSPASFIYPAFEQVPLSIYVVADLDTEDGLGFLRDVLTFVDTSAARSRFTFLPNPTSPNGNLNSGRHTHVSSLFSHLIYKGLLSKATASQLLQVLLGDSGSKQQHRQTVLSTDSPLDELTGGVALADIDRDDYRRYVESGRMVAKMAGLEPGTSGLIINGRVVGPIGAGEFTADDYEVLQEYELAKRVQPVLSALEDIVPAFAGYDRATAADVVSMVSSVVSTLQVEDPSRAGMFNKGPVTRSQTYKQIESQYTAFTVGDNAAALHRFVVFLDPLSEHAQKYTSLFEWLLNIPTVTVEFHLLPPEYTELPLKRFYRYNLIPSLTFDDTGHELPAQVLFRDLPIEPIYTLGLDEPSSWLVRPREALYDLDNVQLGVLSGDERQRGVEAVFELDYIIVGGHAREKGTTNSPPRGVQLQLASHHGTPVDDTLVVENLGYLQFKATPGVYHLEIREGRGREIFRIESAGNEGWLSPPVEEAGNQVTVTSFEGLTLYPRLARLPDQEFVDVLGDPEEEEMEPTGIVDNIVSRISSVFKSSESKVENEVSTQRHAEINIFTVASGLLYERFASIMILSVLRNTEHTVKFWFIENFLSPSFLEFIPHFAQEYGFQYELVTYKWPTWLRQQREKQRIIWAYKILFLDVLFPMDLDKVIFVDADQIVRADLKELIDLDLHGAPYGYTPMGDDNVDMEGFRFWKTGYWEQFLRGRPYHISALYVVDLIRFRQMAAGDILRSHYQQLSADPNSLANLDQDLPNNLQGHVPIYSLHEDWLWCETWCSKDRLNRAKTIDLCQNPLTKEPKLARARQIPEWELYDAEIARFTRTLANDGRIHASAAAADVNELAKVGSVPVSVPASGEEEEEGDHEVTTGPIRDEL